MDGLVPGRIVYYVFDEASAAEVMRRRTTGKSIADRIKQEVVTLEHGTVPQWPLGAQAHIGNDVHAGDVYPAMVIRVWGSSGCSNLKVMLDGSDTYWATSVNYAEWSDGAESLPTPRSWHWMFSGQQKRYDPKPAPPPVSEQPF
jgi:hypothetical protein